MAGGRINLDDSYLLIMTNPESLRLLAPIKMPLLPKRSDLEAPILLYLTHLPLN